MTNLCDGNARCKAGRLVNAKLTMELGDDLNRPKTFQPSPNPTIARTHPDTPTRISVPFGSGMGMNEDDTDHRLARAQAGAVVEAERIGESNTQVAQVLPLPGFMPPPMFSPQADLNRKAAQQLEDLFNEAVNDLGMNLEEARDWVARQVGVERDGPPADASESRKHGGGSGRDESRNLPAKDGGNPKPPEGPNRLKNAMVAFAGVAVIKNLDKVKRIERLVRTIDYDGLHRVYEITDGIKQDDPALARQLEDIAERAAGRIQERDDILQEMERLADPGLRKTVERAQQSRHFERFIESDPATWEHNIDNLVDPEGFRHWRREKGLKLLSDALPREDERIAPAESYIWQNLLPMKGEERRHNGMTGNKRRTFSYDRQHGGEIEVYDGQGEPISVIDALIGQTKNKSVKRHRPLDRPEPDDGNVVV